MTSVSLVQTRLDTGRRARGRRWALDVWGLHGALLLATALGAAGVLEVTADGPAIHVLALGMLAGALRAAVFKPRDFPLYLAVYVPYNYRYPLIILDISGFNLTNLFLLIALLAWVSSRLKREQRNPVNPFDVLLVSYISLAVLACVRAAETGSLPLSDALMEIRDWVRPILFYFVVKGLVEDRRDARNVLTVILYSALMCGLANWVEGRDLSGASIEKARSGGMLSQPNATGAFLVYYGAPLLGLFLFPASGRKMRWACLAGFLVMVRSLLYTYSRGAYLALMVATASMLLLRNPIFLIGGIAVGFGADSVGLVPDSVRSRLGHSQKDDVEIYDPDVTANLDSSAQKRIVLWGAAREMIAAYPWRGVGLNRFEYEVDTYVDTPLDARHPRDAHNAYLLTAAEMGLPALVLMILLLVSLLLAALATHFSRRRDRFDRGLALGLVGTISGVATSCMLGSRFSDDGVIGYFWMLAALLIVVRGLGRHAESGDESPSAGRS